MNVIPVHEPATHVSGRLRRTVVGVLLLGGAALATATVLAHREPEAAPFRVGIARSEAQAASLAVRPANAGEDTGPGFCESEVARLPENRR